MHASVITSKGQTTIPREVRDALGVEPGDRIVYEVVGDCVRIRSARALVEDLNGILSREGRPAVDLDAAREAFQTYMALRAHGSGDE